MNTKSCLENVYINYLLANNCKHLYYGDLLLDSERSFKDTMYFQHNALEIQATNLRNVWRATNLTCITGLDNSVSAQKKKLRAKLMYLSFLTVQHK